MKIAVIGSGYVGLTTAVGFAKLGHEVICIDIDKARIDSLKKGQSPIFESGLENELRLNLKAGRLSFATETENYLQQTEALFIAVGTPGNADGSVHLRSIEEVTETIIKNLHAEQIVVMKSTVPVGTCKTLQNKFPKLLIVSNPEFLREGLALQDFLNPQRVILGTDSAKAVKVLSDLYLPLLKSAQQIIVMDSSSAEMTKYAANAMLASRISLMNEVSRLCEKLGADISLVSKGVGSDARIGADFLSAGVGFGGSCLPKDLNALIEMGSANNEDLQMTKAIKAVNETQKKSFTKKVIANLGDPANKCIAVWGLSFKPGTDDMRDAPSVGIIEELLAKGFSVRVYDPAASLTAQKTIKDAQKIFFADDPLHAVENCNALCILTEWEHFQAVDMISVKQKMKSALVFDGRNIFAPNKMKELGFKYFAVGRSV